MAIYVLDQPEARGRRLERVKTGNFGPPAKSGIFCFWAKTIARERRRAEMIISMKLHSTREEIDEVCAIVKHHGYKVHSIEGEERVVIGVVGVGDVTACLESVEAMPQVEKVVRITAPYKFVSKEFRKGKTRIRVDGTEIGGDDFVVIAGPCSVESEEQIMRSAEAVAKAG